MRTASIALGALLTAALPIGCGDDGSTGGTGGGNSTSSSAGSSGSSTSSSSSSAGGSGGNNGSGGEGGEGAGGAGGENVGGLGGEGGSGGEGVGGSGGEGVGGSGGDGVGGSGGEGVGGSGGEGGSGAACGDGVLTAGEQCDDANADDNDGCSASCLVEAGFICSGVPAVCEAVCGDGIIVGPESCDDGNASPGDGCVACVVQLGFLCTGVPSTCTPDADGQVISTGDGLNLQIADDTYDGTLASMSCVTLDAAAQVVSGVIITVGVSHPWIGDLTFKLVSPAGTTVTLMSRPGAPERADDGATPPVGNGADLDPGSPVTFETAAAVSAEDMGSDLIDSDSVVCEEDGICSFAPANGAAPPGDLTSFMAPTAEGAWQFCAGDSGGEDDGAIDAVTLTLN